MSRVIKIFNKKRSAISLIFIFLIFSNCSFIESNNYSFYETFINPDVSDLSEEFDNESVKPDLDSVPESVDIDE
tara:strand:+ start:933 stop:1154 length:222 start_codon:yes stop_codon:yes gene_type:complete